MRLTLSRNFHFAWISSFRVALAKLLHAQPPRLHTPRSPASPKHVHVTPAHAQRKARAAATCSTRSRALRTTTRRAPQRGIVAGHAAHGLDLQGGAGRFPCVRLLRAPQRACTTFRHPSDGCGQQGGHGRAQGSTAAGPLEVAVERQLCRLNVAAVPLNVQPHGRGRRHRTKYHSTRSRPALRTSSPVA